MNDKNYLMVNESTNVVDDLCVWDGNTDTWQPPSGYLMLVQEITPAIIWVINADKTDYTLETVIGAGSIGFTWDGSTVTTNLPKPEIPKPIVTP